MSKINLTYDRISSYFRGLLSNRERHTLEKEMMQDVFEEEAFEGLNHITADELDRDMTVLANRIDQRLNRDKKKSMVRFYRIAAGIIMVAGLGTVLYMFLKPPQAEMITQQVTREEAPETVIPSAPEVKEIESRAEDEQKGIVLKQVKKDAQIPPTEKGIEEKPEMLKQDEYNEVQISEYQEDVKIAAPSQSVQSLPTEESSKDKQPQYITGRVIGINRVPLAGVSILEKGTARGTISDMDGKFWLQVRDSGTQLTLNYLGYKAVELSAGEIAGKEISLDENLVALNEVVVIGYGTQNKNRSDQQSAETARKAQASSTAPYIYSKPVPPGGTMWQFEKWVEERIDTEKFRDLLPGNYKIRVTLLIRTDGSPGNITVKNDVPEVVSDEYKRVVSQSPVWQPALKDKMFVEAEVMISFSLKIE